MKSDEDGRAHAVSDVAGGYVLATVEIAAPPERVFRALASKAIVDWWIRPGVFETTDWVGDVRVGGRWQATGVARGQPYTLAGEFLEIDPPRKLVHTWHLVGVPGEPTIVTYVLEELNGGTRVTLRHSGFSPGESGANVSAGWESSFRHLANMFSDKGSGRQTMTPHVAGANPQITPEERVQILGWLEASHKEFLAAIDSVPEDQWNWKPDPARWSVAETAEHIVLAEALLFGLVGRSLAGLPNPCWEEQTRGKTELIIQVIPSRDGRGSAPEPLVPHERLSRTEVKERFASARIDIVRFARETQLALKEFTLAHPFPIFGTLNAYQWLIYVPLHTLRHTKQIAELTATSGCP